MTDRPSSLAPSPLSEADHRELFALAPGPLWALDAQTLHFLAVNDAAVACYGYSPREFLAMTATDLVPPGDQAAWAEALAAAPGLDLRSRWRHQRKDGTIFDVEISGRRVALAGRPAWIVLCLDATTSRLTEQKHFRLNSELERQVADANAQLAALRKELDAFSYSVSHDLRAPLRSIRGFSEVLLEQYTAGLDARGRDFLRRVTESSRHLERLIEDLLKLSRAGSMELHGQAVSLSRLAQSIVAELRQSDPNRTVAVQLAPGLEAWGDEQLLRQVLQHFLHNAWKFTSRRADGLIELGYDASQSAFFIRDNGAGFDLAYAAKLFGAFQRLHPADEFPGNGIGLAIVQRIINRHGGSVWAQAAVGQGATFFFRIPQAAPVLG
ncbi:MAG TPA: ATP-binding protein [Verrucomicrobiae bacterium]